MNGKYSPYDPFILPHKVRQVYYAPYPSTCTKFCSWCFAITTKPRDHVEVDNIEEEFPYQAT